MRHIPAFSEGDCPICGGRPDRPFRVYDERGKVTSGCVDATHTGQFYGNFESALWHIRPAAEAIRKASKDHLRKLMTGRKIR